MPGASAFFIIIKNDKVMTVLQALKISVGYPLDAAVLEKITIDRHLDPADEYTGPTREFMLARADVYMALVATPDVAMDGFSLSVADRNLLAALSESIYRRYAPGEDRPGVAGNGVWDGSDKW